LYYDLSTRITLQLNNTDNPMALGTTGKQYQIMGITHDWQSWKNCWHTTWQLWDLNQYKIVHDILQIGASIGVTNESSYTPAHAAASGTPINGMGAYDVGQINAGGITPYSIDRGYIEIDTSGIPAGIQILGVDLFLSAVSVVNVNTVICLVDPDGLTHPVIGTNYHDLLASTAVWGTGTIPSGNSNPYSLQITLNSLGIAALNIGGTTKFGLRALNDIIPTAPSSVEDAAFDASSAGAYIAVRFNF